MAWLDEAIEPLNARPVCGYRREEEPAVEPTALAALALMSTNRVNQATPALEWLLNVQSIEGSLGINANTPKPCWPTGWAILAWTTAAKRVPDAKKKWSAAAVQAVDWVMKNRGCPIQSSEDEFKIVSHDTTLQGWSWVIGTHSWVEPTAINVLALRNADLANSPHYHEAVKLLLDRQLPKGGWNYGNTITLGNELRPHVQATGLALAALAKEKDVHPKIQRSLDWLQRTLSDNTTTASLCYALMGLAGHGIRPTAAEGWLSAAYGRTMAHGGSPYHLALLVLAAKQAVG
jgi:hypothetical protein